MKQFDNILLISDMDGTLIDETWTISKENIEAAKYFMENGGTFTYATGRQMPIAKEIIDQLVPNAPVICYNGAAIYDYRIEEYLWSSEMDRSCKAIIDDLLENFPVVNIEINTREGIYTLKDIDYAIPRYEKFNPFFTGGKTAESITSPWLKVVIVTRDADMEALRAHVRSHPLFEKFQFSQSATFLYEILNPGMNKGSTLLELKRILGNKHKVIAVGDNENDIDLVKAADVGFAVGDGSPLLHSCCRNRTVSLKENVLVDIVNKIEGNII